ncbi:hypothetical protein CKM354_000682900 [Cercospora kikuchii]|uniref:2EXR domain-containing protein n=1 Tax=Cercospora kikuchii TaxID=84275 RepID=A0A9P3CNC9_9PEZI|nr:uncharacterized protein CKM354_000682900 [Cercospora kikuchii]GIZ43610.1 hypothetical protein CKM354_000682900 [Cercospora kikuchii]
MDSWPFRKLAPELRNKIWELVLIHEDPIVVRNSVKTPGCRTKPEYLTALLQVCKESKNECSEMFYASNTFVLESFSGASSLDEDLRRFIYKLGNNVPLVKTAIISAGTIDVLHRDSSCFYRICYGELDLLGHWRSRLSSLRFEVRLTKKHSVERDTLWDNGGLLLNIDVFDLPASFRQAMDKISTAMGGKTVNLLAMESKIHLSRYDELCARQEGLGESTQASGPVLMLQSGKKAETTSSHSLINVLDFWGIASRQVVAMDESPLGRLPPELRNGVWHLAVTQDKPINLSTYQDEVYIWPCYEKINWVFKTCKQIYNECAAMMYANNTFAVPVYGMYGRPDRRGFLEQGGILDLLRANPGTKRMENLVLCDVGVWGLPEPPQSTDFFVETLWRRTQQLGYNNNWPYAPHLRLLSWEALLCKDVKIQIDLRNPWQSLLESVGKARKAVATLRQEGEKEYADQLEDTIVSLYIDYD